MLLSRTRWFAPDSPVGVWWLAHCHGFRVDPPPHFGPSGTVDDVLHLQVGGPAELLVVRIGRGRARATRPIAVADVVGVDPQHRVLLVRTSLRRAARRAKRTARTLGWKRDRDAARYESRR